MAFHYPLITLEEHFLAKAAQEFYQANGTRHPDDNPGSPITPKLLDVGKVRLGSMNESHVSIQVISHSPNLLALDLATSEKINDELQDHIMSHPKRFRGLATLPMKYPEDASKELHRCVKELQFVGALIDSNCEGRFYDDPYFWPVFKAAVDLDVPIYLHPNINLGTKPLLYDGHYDDAVATSLSRYVWGWHSETGIHFLRLFAAGLFDTYPNLKLILGHLGEMLPFQLDRIQRIVDVSWAHQVQRKLRDVWDTNVWITSAGMFSLAPMAAVLRQCKPERILFSVDYPFDENKEGLDFMTDLKVSNLVSENEMQNIAYKNAEILLKVKVEDLVKDPAKE